MQKNKLLWCHQVFNSHRLSRNSRIRPFAAVFNNSKLFPKVRFLKSFLTTRPYMKRSISRKSILLNYLRFTVQVCDIGQKATFAECLWLNVDDALGNIYCMQPLASVKSSVFYALYIFRNNYRLKSPTEKGIKAYFYNRIWNNCTVGSIDQNIRGSHYYGVAVIAAVKYTVSLVNRNIRKVPAIIENMAINRRHALRKEN